MTLQTSCQYLLSNSKDRFLGQGPIIGNHFAITGKHFQKLDFQNCEYPIFVLQLQEFVLVFGQTETDGGKNERTDRWKDRRVS